MALLSLDSRWQQESSKNRSFHATGDPLASIYNEGIWRLNMVSPLYGMHYSPRRLKMFATKARQAIISSVQASSAKYQVMFEEQPNLKYSEDDASGMRITVLSYTDTDPKPKVPYVAFLLSWGISERVDKAVHLPYLLERGNQRVGVAVKSILQSIYDCNIRPFTFTQHQLLQFALNLVGTDTSHSVDTFTLTYKDPQTDLKETLKLSFDVRDVHLIWNGIKEEAVNHSELVNVAYRILQNQVFYMLNLDITTFELSEISLPKAEIKSNGAVKMKTPEIVNCVFTVLNENNNTMSGADDVNMIMED